MQFRDCRCEAKAQTISGAGSTTLKPIEAAQYLVPLRYGDTFTVIADCRHDGMASHIQFQIDRASRRRVLQSIFNEVDEQLREQVVIGLHPGILDDARHNRAATIACRSGIGVGNGMEKLGEVDRSNDFRSVVASICAIRSRAEKMSKIRSVSSTACSTATR